MLCGVMFMGNNLRKVNKKREEKKREWKEKTLKCCVHQGIESGVHNFKRTHFVENDYSCRWNHRKRLEYVPYMCIGSLVSCTQNSGGHNLYSS